MRLQLGGNQHGMHRTGGKSEFGGQGAHAPAALILRLLTYARLQFAPGLGIMLGRPSGARGIAQAFDAVHGKGSPPLSHRDRWDFNAAAICWLFDPSAAAKTMRLRSTNDCGVDGEATNLSRVLRVCASR